ncbi:keratin-associated protein 26-1 [Nycticebus coucang]|uniref:keratin-associated protein 26-1 n=1 Tax=Nycticebus coucang TaxID=9470 RepID=UPI00234C2685|nr:keratin-associated protein 26-1 [Nycticebus coucang]
MSCPNYCSGNFSSGALRNSCPVPSTSSVAICSTNVSCGDALCLPSSFQDHTWLTDNCQETCGEPASCRPANLETSCCSSSAYYLAKPCQGSSFLPASSFISSSCLPGSCRPLSFVSSSCCPQNPLLNSGQLVGGCVPSGCRPLPCLSTSCQPQGLFTYGYRPVGCLTYRPQTLPVVSSSLRPLGPSSSGCQPLTRVFGTCRPPCSAQGGQ